jgi:hypothetical protein
MNNIRICHSCWGQSNELLELGLVGLTFWAPILPININIFMDTRWGRGQEGQEIPRKDPIYGHFSVWYMWRAFRGDRIGKLVEKLGVGLEGNERWKVMMGHGSGGLMVFAYCNHFITCNFDKWQNFSRCSFN